MDALLREALVELGGDEHLDDEGSDGARRDPGEQCQEGRCDDTWGERTQLRQEDGDGLADAHEPQLLQEAHEHEEQGDVVDELGRGPIDVEVCRPLFSDDPLRDVLVEPRPSQDPARHHGSEHRNQPPHHQDAQQDQGPRPSQEVVDVVPGLLPVHTAPVRSR